MLFRLLVVYLKYAIIIFLMFTLFNAIRVRFNEQALYIGQDEKKVVLTALLAYILIDLVFGGGFFASLLGLAAFVFIYAYFTGRLK